MASLVVLLAAPAAVLVVVAIAIRWQTWPDTRDRQGAQWKGRIIGRAMAVFASLAVLVGLGYWVWWGLWGNQPPEASPPPDRWLNFLLGLGALAAVLAFLGSGYLALRYGRRASVSITAKPLAHPTGVVLAVRPMVKAIGLFRVKFHGPKGAVVRIAEWYIPAGYDPQIGFDPGNPKGPSFVEGRVWEHVAVFGEQFAEAGEELFTTSTFLVPRPSPSTVGWSISLAIIAPTRWMPGSSGSWADRIFVPRPKIDG